MLYYDNGSRVGRAADQFGTLTLMALGFGFGWALMRFLLP